ncbi:MAG: PKD domain-containing protein [Bacteroidia bacterium]|nr:PKD domain-containing protein [Bacteroidia bacterium]
MKTITKHLKQFALVLALLGIGKTYAQGCFPNFTYNVNPNGVVSFTSTSAGVNSITTQYYWNFPGGSPSTFTGTGGLGTIANTSYSASGIYTVNLFILTVPSCSNSITQTIAVNIASTPTCAISINTTAASGTNICNGTVTVAGSATVANIIGPFCGAPSYTWFPGGMTGSAAFQLCPNVTYTVFAAGLSGTNCCSIATGTFAINGLPTPTCNVNANFSYTVGANGSVNFTNWSTGTNSVSSTYTWSFGNGQSSNALNASTTYTANGQYWVSLWASNGPSCWDSTSVLVNVNTVTGGTCNLNANFSFNYGANGSVNFVNTSTGTVSPVFYSWYFGNGQGSNLANPSITYTANGSYQVKLKVTNNPTLVPVCVDSIIQVVNITNAGGPCNLSASFTHTVGANGLVNFGNSSTGTNSNTVYFWNFGDGTTGFGANPNHTYPSAGAYFVIMTAINNSVNCMSTASTAINVTGINCVANANFSVAPTPTAQFWTATPSFPWNVTNAVWSWGDGSSSNGLYSSHSYSAAGMYGICLNVTVSCGSSASTCATYSISKMNAANAMIQINVVPPQLLEVGIEDQVSAFDGFNFYPNPNNGLLNVELNSINNAPYGIQIIDLSGRIVLTTSIDSPKESNQKVIDLHTLPNGVYILQLEQAGQRLNKKLVISKD